MKLLITTAFLYGILTSYGFSEISELRENRRVKAIVMPVEMIDKVIVRGSLISAIRNPFTSTHKGISMFRNRGETIVEPLLNKLTEIDDQYRKQNTIEDVLKKMNMPDPVPGKIQYLIGGKAFYHDISQEIQRAEQSIDTRVYIFDNDDVAINFADLLKKKSNTIQCRVLMDELGSLAAGWEAPQTKSKQPEPGGDDIADYLEKNSQVKVRKSRNPWLVTDHCKLYLIDRKIAYLGGMNIGREYRYEWHDMMVKISGPAVSALQNDFNRAWRLQGGLGDWTAPFYKSITFRQQKEPGEIDLRLLKTKPGKTDVEQSILAAIRMSKKRVYLQNSYFTSDALLNELLMAQQRGIDVRIILPEENTSELLRIGNQAKAKQLVEMGVKVYMHKPFTHVKAVVVDNWACLGSANFDALSFKINEELNISFTDTALVNRLVEDLFMIDFRRSILLKNSDVKGWANPFIESIADQL